MALAPVRTVDALIHVVRAFQDDSVPHSEASIDAERDKRNLDYELMLADKYTEAVRGAAAPVDVRVLDGINHMGIVAAPKAVAIVAEDVATRAMAGS